MPGLAALPALPAGAWALLALAALFVGIAKTSVQNLVFFAVAAFAIVLPTRESTATVVVLLVVADLIAVWRYHRLCDWPLLKRLLPYVIPGEILGVVFLALVSDAVLKVIIGVLLIGLLVPQILQIVRRSLGARRRPGERPPEITAPHPVLTGFVGVVAGFTTMAANASGPIFTWYLLLLRVDKRGFLGTGAIFFAVVNLLKIPAGLTIGLFTPAVIAVGVVLIPVTLLGTVLGSWLVKRMSQRVFDLVAVGMSLVAALALVLPH